MSNGSSPPLQAVFDVLHAAWGPQHWWPADTPWEMMVGAVLAQNTAWVNAEKAINQLKKAGAMNFHAMHEAGPAQVESWIRPSGTFRVKTRRLFALMELIRCDFGGDLDRFLRLPKASMRERLLQVGGIGPETADCIVLYAGGHPAFVIDAYTRRILSRHAWIKGGEPYGELARLFESNIQPEALIYAEYHALLVRVGKNHCRSQPACASCPLNSFLPGEGPRD